jgi:hypothetical protein
MYLLELKKHNHAGLIQNVIHKVMASDMCVLAGVQMEDMIMQDCFRMSYTRSWHLICVPAGVQVENMIMQDCFKMSYTMSWHLICLYLLEVINGIMELCRNCSRMSDPMS